jgi:pimeloyl-ACP methyl ester carboxylesterase
MKMLRVPSTKTRLSRITVDGVELFYREAGAPDAPTILLLHGFPTSSHMFRDLIPELAGEYRVIAPDLPGFGFSQAPDRSSFTYSFANLANLVGKFVDAIGLGHFAVYVFDYGAPVGFRLAAARPGQITAIVSQNGNAYVEGLSEGWNPIRAYWADPSDANLQALRGMLAPQTTLFQYTHGVADTSQIAPESYTLDDALLARPGIDEIQLDLFGDYRSNVEAYSAIQAYFRAHQPPFLAVWGKNDPFFLPAGAEAFRRDLPQADIRFFDTGHFALETHAAEIGAAIRDFLTTLGGLVRIAA